MQRQLTDTALPEDLPEWGVLLLESHHSPTFTMDWRTHSFLKIVFVLAGKGEFQFANRSYSFEPGHVIVIPPDQQNRIEDDPSSAASLYICCLSTSLFEFDESLINEFEIRRFEEGRHFSNQVASLMRRMAYAQNSAKRFRSVAMVSEAMDLVQLVLKQNSQTSKTNPKHLAQRHQEEITRYIQTLQSEFFEATTINAAADRLGMPRRTFTKLFAEQAGETWLQHVRRLAIEHAAVRLIESDSPVISIAFECGFNDLSTFYRQFKSQLGMSPAAYRLKSKKGSGSQTTDSGLTGHHRNHKQGLKDDRP